MQPACDPSASSVKGGTAAGALRLTRYRSGLSALEALDLPAYLGSTLRGAFGHVFRRIACLAPQGGPCPAPQTCPYHFVFEPAPPPDAVALSSLDDIPRPFVIAPPPAAKRTHEAGSELSFDLTLIGRAQEMENHEARSDAPAGTAYDFGWMWTELGLERPT